jgi:hypothetical protein
MNYLEKGNNLRRDQISVNSRSWNETKHAAAGDDKMKKLTTTNRSKPQNIEVEQKTVHGRQKEQKRQTFSRRFALELHAVPPVTFILIAVNCSLYYFTTCT